MPGFRPVFYMEGFDERASPHWQMVPVNGDRFVALRGGAGLTVRSCSPSIVTVQEITQAQLPASGHCRLALEAGDRIFRLHGAAKGSARIQARRGAAPEVELAVDTKHRKTLRVSFNLVSDPAGHHTVRPPASIPGWMPIINGVFNGQANVAFELRLVRPITVAGNLGDQVTICHGGEEEWNRVTALANRDRGADVNFFLVWELEQTASPTVDSLEALMAPNGACLVEDNLHGIEAVNIAHELGHRLGVRDHYDASRSQDLMYGYPSRGTNLPKDHVNVMNP
jgi:hypothetical protein